MAVVLCNERARLCEMNRHNLKARLFSAHASTYVVVDRIRTIVEQLLE